uniref:Putative secreted protein n=1 Tax=Anopheles marajoara TaxID=58244 RepID=A0A2M4C662_9DIPT
MTKFTSNRSALAGSAAVSVTAAFLYNQASSGPPIDTRIVSLWRPVTRNTRRSTSSNSSCTPCSVCEEIRCNRASSSSTETSFCRIAFGSGTKSILLPTLIIRSGVSVRSPPLRISEPSVRSTWAHCSACASCAISCTCTITSASMASSSVATKHSISPVGMSDMKPTVSM